MDSLSALRGRRCLVTGARGFIGTSLSRLLCQALADVSSPSREELDVCDSSAVGSHVRCFAPEFVFHLASEGVSQTVPLDQLRRSNVAGTENLVVALSRLPIAPRVVLLGSGFEYAAKDGLLSEADRVAPFSDYGVSKAEACARARQKRGGLPVAWVRLFNVYGPGESTARLLPYLASRAAEGLPVEVTPAEQLRDFAYVDDVAEGLLRLALSLPEQPAWEVCNFGSGRGVRLRDFIEEGVAALRERGLRPDVRFGAKPYRPGEPMMYLPDISKLRERLHWSPPTSLAQGVRLAVASILGSS